MKQETMAAGAEALSRTTSRVAFIAVCAGAIALAGGILFGHGRTALGFLTSGWLFCAGLAAGAVALSAAVRVVGGRWADAALPAAEAAARFFVPALILLVIIASGAHSWMPAAMAPHGLALALLVLREFFATGVLFIMGRRYVSSSRAAREHADGGGAARPAVIYLLLYAAVLSLWASDFVIAPAQGAPSTVVPVLYFMGAFLGGIAWTTLVAVARGFVTAASRRRDLSNMIFAFAAFWAYLVWSAYLPVWYENMPDETAQLLARWGGNWRFLTAGALATVFVFPFISLFPEAERRGKTILTVGSAVVLAGLLGISSLFVLPSLSMRIGWAGALTGALVVLGVIGLFLLVADTGLVSVSRGRSRS
jgi:hypothetical protein